MKEIQYHLIQMSHLVEALEYAQERSMLEL